MPTTLLEPRFTKDLSSLETKLGVTFQNKDLLIQALVHRSFLNENRDFPLGHNERLEFLGDAVLELVVTEYLYNHYDNPEGELTNWRASLVNSNMLSTLTNELQIEDLLYMSRGEQRDTNGKARLKILANVFESLVGAIYLEHGYDAAKKFIMDRLLVKLDYILQNKLYLDPKTYFQEQAQEKTNITPTYRVLSEDGPDHDKTFTVGIYLGTNQVATGTGSSKQAAQVSAAHNAIKVKGWWHLPGRLGRPPLLMQEGLPELFFRDILSLKECPKRGAFYVNIRHSIQKTLGIWWIFTIHCQAITTQTNSSRSKAVGVSTR